MTVSIVDYGVSNIASVLNMLSKVGVTAMPASTPDQIEAAERLLLPGVGSFDYAMEELHRRHLVGPILSRAQSGTPVLGICLGMQLLSMSSAEGTSPGLGLIDAHCLRLTAGEDTATRIPHMGWNTISSTRDDPLLDALPESTRFYFVHSYHLQCNDAKDSLATTRHGIEFTSVARHDNVMGAQFHPEKSHRYGMILLKNFAWTPL